MKLKTKYDKQNGALEIAFGNYYLYLNHPVVFAGSTLNEFQEKETRVKLSFGTGLHYNSNSYLNYFYFGFMFLGLGFGLSRQAFEL